MSMGPHGAKNRISKLHKDELMDLPDLELFETCEPCLTGKTTKALFIVKGERASDLLVLCI